MDKNEYGKLLRKIRKSKGFSIRQLEMYSGVSNAYISQLECGERGIPSPDIIRKLADALKFNYQDLMIAAGYNDSSSEVSVTDEDEQELIRDYSRLSQEDKEIVRTMIKRLIRI